MMYLKSQLEVGTIEKDDFKCILKYKFYDFFLRDVLP